MGFASTNPGGGGILFLNYSVLFDVNVFHALLSSSTHVLFIHQGVILSYFVIFTPSFFQIHTSTRHLKPKNGKPIFPLFLFLLQTSRATPDLTAVTTGLQECSTDGQRSTDWLQTTNH